MSTATSLIPSILITQCLQMDFVKPINKYERLPNRLHVGYEEAKRLMGEKPAEGPVVRMVDWAMLQPSKNLNIIHIRDWHDIDDPGQGEHLRQFGPHCLKNSVGADFVFSIINARNDVEIINSLSLNDFVETKLADILDPWASQKVRVGLMGVWTEAKISYLAYELRTRYPNFEISVCSALTASSSRAHHFMALDQLNKILGVIIHSSVGEFMQFLGGGTFQSVLPAISPEIPNLHFETDFQLAGTDLDLLRYLFRDSKSVKIKILDGGFSGNVVVGSESIDIYGNRQVPHVLKIGKQASIGHERESFEKVESILGNNAPHIVDFADFNGRGAIKYRYASMGGGFSTTFQKLYCQGLPKDKIEKFLSVIFIEQLGRFYQAGTLEKCNLLEYYQFNSPDLKKSVRTLVEKVIGYPISGDEVQIGTKRISNICLFYELTLQNIFSLAEGSAFLSTVHGDLNGANILVDSQENLWLIDFFHTHRGHILKDLIKLENDILYIYTSLNNESDLEQAIALTDHLMKIEDLAKPLTDLPPSISHLGLRRAFETLKIIRSYYPPLIHENRDPLQLWIGQMRYAVHTLNFIESNALQKKWALVTASLCAERIKDKLMSIGPLRIDWINSKYTYSGHLGITILPGREDYQRSLEDDLKSLLADGITHIIPLLTINEMNIYGVPDLLDCYAKSGLNVMHLPILDQKTCSISEMRNLILWLNNALATGARIVVHCVGGLGRSGMVVAAYIKSLGNSPEIAINEVRRVRTQRAIETIDQETFVKQFN